MRLPMNLSASHGSSFVSLHHGSCTLTRSTPSTSCPVSPSTDYQSSYFSNAVAVSISSSTSEASTAKCRKQLSPSQQAEFRVSLTYLMTCLLALGLFAFCTFHIYLMSCNYTTIEFLEKHGTCAASVWHQRRAIRTCTRVACAHAMWARVHQGGVCPCDVGTCPCVAPCWRVCPRMVRMPTRIPMRRWWWLVWPSCACSCLLIRDSGR